MPTAVLFFRKELAIWTEDFERSRFYGWEEGAEGVEDLGGDLNERVFVGKSWETKTYHWMRMIRAQTTDSQTWWCSGTSLHPYPHKSRGWSAWLEFWGWWEFCALCCRPIHPWFMAQGPCNKACLSKPMIMAYSLYFMVLCWDEASQSSALEWWQVGLDKGVLDQTTPKAG